MGLPLLKEAFEAVQAAPIPSDLPSSDDAAALRDMLAQIVNRSERQVENWKRQAVHLMRDIPLATDEYLSSDGDIKELIADLETLRAEISSRQEKLVLLSNQAHAIAGGSDHSGLEMLFGNSGLLLDHATRMNALAERDIAIGSELLDFLTITISDIDPETRGGPGFDNADDLIAFLHGQVRA